MLLLYYCFDLLCLLTFEVVFLLFPPLVFFIFSKRPSSASSTWRESEKP